MNAALLLVLLPQNPLVTTTGYFDSRTTGAWTQFDGAPALTELLEANVQVKLNPHEKVTLYTDASLFWQGAWLIQGGERDLPQYRPTVVLSEMYADLVPQEHFRFLIGKKRIVWGAGMSFNPTDLLNPPKDPTDPTFQRAGAWLAQAEWGFEKVALSAVFAAKTTRQFAGLPTALVVYPELPSAEVARGLAIDDRDKEPHYVFTARLYLLWKDIDINVIYGFSNLYADAFTNKSRVGLSLSRVFGGLELHGEGLLYTGSARVDATAECVDTPELCVFRGVPLLSRPYLKDDFINARALVGGRYQFENGALLAAEYYFNGEGQDADGFKRLATLALHNPALAQAALLGNATDPGTPQKFSFEPFRKHYFVLQFQKPQLWDDWTISATALVGLEDLSAQLVPMIQWMPKEWLQLTAIAYIPIAGVASLGVEFNGKNYGQFTLSPFQTRVMFQARAFF